jgi:hypothetical protein
MIDPEMVMAGWLPVALGTGAVDQSVPLDDEA